MRLTLELLGRRFALDLSAEKAEDCEPQPEGSTCGSIERAGQWDHDQRVPVGFRNKEGA